MNTLLRWAGSKRKLLPILTTIAPKDFERYVEPFAGSACLFFALDPLKALLGDINSELIGTYRQVKRHSIDVARYLAGFKHGKREYYRLRELNPKALDPQERAARFIYLNRFSFNGLYRTNRSGQFNVPYGGSKPGTLPSVDMLSHYSKKLKKANLISGSFQLTLEQVKEGDFVYLDPPYSISSRRVFREYHMSDFGSKDLRNLRSQLEHLDRKGIPFLVSYGLSREGNDLAKGFHARLVTVQRVIAGFSENRRKSRELLITNY